MTMENLLEKESKATSLLSRISEENKVAVSFSGGRDSLVALDLAIRTGVEETVFVDTTIDFEENLEFLYEVEDYYGININRVSADIDFFDAVERVGFPSRRLRWCCDVFKFKPIADYAEENDIDGFITGIRGEESDKRKTYIDIDKNPLIPSKQVNPLIDWCRSHVEKYIEKYNLPENPLYQYVERLGCWCCPFRSEKEWEQIEENFPELMEKLHKKLDKFADEIGIEDKESFIKDRKWTGWASPQEKTKVGAHRVCGGNSGEREIMFFGEQGDLIERIRDLLPILVEEDFSIGSRLKVTIEEGKEKRLNTLIEKAINCIGCGACTAVCPEGALEINGEERLEVNPELCTHCERCLNTNVLKGACVVRNYSPQRRTLTSYR